MNYIRALIALFPTGPAWNKARGSDLYKLIDALSQEFTRIDERIDDLLREIFPPTSVDLLPEWEEVFGLPDSCVSEKDIDQTISDRQSALAEKMFRTADQSRQYYILAASRLGYTITIEEPEPDYWIVRAPANTISYFRAGRNAAGDRLANWGNDTLDCLFERIKPAHTEVTITYG